MVIDSSRRCVEQSRRNSHVCFFTTIAAVLTSSIQVITLAIGDHKATHHEDSFDSKLLSENHNSLLPVPINPSPEHPTTIEIRNHSPYSTPVKLDTNHPTLAFASLPPAILSRELQHAIWTSHGRYSLLQRRLGLREARDSTCCPHG